MKSLKQVITEHYKKYGTSVIKDSREGSLKSIQISEQIALPYFIVGYDSERDNLYFSTKIEYTRKKEKTYKKQNLYIDGNIELFRYIIHKDLYDAIYNFKNNPNTKEMMSVFRSLGENNLEFQVFYIPQSNKAPFDIDYNPLYNCGYSYIISESYKQNTYVALKCISIFNKSLDNDKIIFNKYRYIDMENQLLKIEKEQTNSTDMEEDIVNVFRKKLFKEDKGTLECFCPSMKPLGYYITFKLLQEKTSLNNPSHKYTYALLNRDSDDIKGSNTESDVSRLPYEIIANSFIGYMRNNFNNDLLNGLTYIQCIYKVIEDYFKRTDLSFLSNMNISSNDLIPANMSKYISPINFDYLEKYLDFNKSDLNDRYILEEIKSHALYQNIFSILFMLIVLGINHSKMIIMDNDCEEIMFKLQSILSERAKKEKKYY